MVSNHIQLIKTYEHEIKNAIQYNTYDIILIKRKKYCSAHDEVIRCCSCTSVCFRF